MQLYPPLTTCASSSTRQAGAKTTGTLGEGEEANAVVTPDKVGAEGDGSLAEAVTTGTGTGTVRVIPASCFLGREAGCTCVNLHGEIKKTKHVGQANVLETST